MSTVNPTERPLLGLRRRPGRVALWFMRLPQPLYHRGWGRVLGHTFLLITHRGRKTGQRRETVAMALTYDADTKETVVCSAWGPHTEWMRNLRAHPALQVQIGRESYVPEQRFLSEDQAVAAATEFRDRHPGRLRLFATILGWGDLGTEAAVRELVRDRPFVAFRPAPPTKAEAPERATGRDRPRPEGNRPPRRRRPPAAARRAPIR
jgi:deazaflavin-dependent oxidoreductase (nitroreductase family)